MMRRLLKARFWIGIVLLSAIFSLLLACAPSTPPGAPPTAPAAEKKTPKYGGTMRYTSSMAPPTLFPYIKTGRWDAGFAHLYESLVDFRFEVGVDPMALEVIPRLAESWQQVDETTYLFKLKQNVKWHDGEPFTADDVVFSFKFMVDPKNKATQPLANLKDILKSAEALDKYTVRLTTTQPYAPFLYMITSLTNIEAFIIPKHVFDRGGNLDELPVGTGPFRFKEYVKNERAISEKFPDYHVPGRPYVDRVEVTYGLDDAARVAAFRAQQSDFHTVADRAEFEPIQRSMPNIGYEVYMDQFNNIIRFRIDRPPFSDIRVRKAVHLALDRQAFLQTLTFGDGAVNPWILPNPKGRGAWSMPEKDFINEPGFRQPKDADLAEAKRLMAEAGYPNGFKAVFKTRSLAITSARLAPMIATQLKENLRIDTDLQLQEAAVFTEDDTKGNYDMVVFGGQGGSGDPASAFVFLRSDSTLNSMGIKDPELDRMIADQYRIFDKAKRQEAIHKIQQYVGEKLYSVPTITYAIYGFWQPWLVNWRPYTRSINQILGTAAIDVWIDK